MTDRPATEHCGVCGSKLDYMKQAAAFACIYCGRTERGHVVCPEGHFICDACHGKDALRMIEDVAFTTASGDPFEIAELMMGHPALPMLGCEHAYIAAGGRRRPHDGDPARGALEARPRHQRGAPAR